MKRLLVTLASVAGIAGSGAGAVAAVPVAPADLEARTFKDGGGHVLPYRIFVPRKLPGANRVPLVLFLHGSGGRGNDNLRQLTDQAASLVFVQPENQARWPLFMVAPQCPQDQQWVAMPWGAPTGKGQRPAQPTWPLAAALALVDQLQKEYPAIDARQLYVTGMSMGGYGTYDAAARRPGKWRAAVPICGGYDDTQVGPLVNLPLWAFHAADDPTVPVARTREIIAAIRKLGGHPRYTEYPASAHYGHHSWIPAYAEPELLPWMFGTPVEGTAEQATARAADKPAEKANGKANGKTPAPAARPGLKTR